MEPPHCSPPPLRPGARGRRQVQGRAAGDHEPRRHRARGRPTPDRLRQWYLLLRSTARWRRSRPACTCSSRRRSASSVTTNTTTDRRINSTGECHGHEPATVRSAEFKTIRKGATPTEVRVFLDDGRGRTRDGPEPGHRDGGAGPRCGCPPAGASGEGRRRRGADPVAVEASVDESETISRTLLLAQRTADTTVAEAQAEADRMLGHGARRSGRHTSTSPAPDGGTTARRGAKAEARQAGEAERLAVRGRGEALMARRDFLESDVDHLESYLVAQRERVREAAASLLDVADRVPGGLADMRRRCCRHHTMTMTMTSRPSPPTTRRPSANP